MFTSEDYGNTWAVSACPGDDDTWKVVTTDSTGLLSLAGQQSGYLFRNTIITPSPTLAPTTTQPVTVPPTFSPSVQPSTVAPTLMPTVWTEVNSSGESCWDALASSSSGEVVYAAASNMYNYTYIQKGLYVSTDYGQSFVKSAALPESAWMAVACSANGSFVLANPSQGIYFSTDYGATFTQGSYTVSQLSFRSIVTGSTGQYSYALTWNYGVYGSSDYGKTMSYVYSLPAIPYGYSGVAMSSSGQYVYATPYYLCK